MAAYKRWIPMLLVSLALVVAGCSKEEPVEEKTAEEPAEQAAPAAEKEAAPAAEAKEEPAAEEEPATEVKVKAKKGVNKEMLARAYEEVYCAQKRGKTEKILEIYKKYGFETPKEWTEAWAETAEEPEWQAELTRKVQSSKCK